MHITRDAFGDRFVGANGLRAYPCGGGYFHIVKDNQEQDLLRAWIDKEQARKELIKGLKNKREKKLNKLGARIEALIESEDITLTIWDEHTQRFIEGDKFYFKVDEMDGKMVLDTLIEINSKEV